ncbi:cell wall metabolism sensor histidine kinase WalK [Marinilabilia salmonicolor]|jgi:two-component system phosphate regulon sensor histidine kinase PhoR|uniref:histidine kinase n=1 Tax=Marinilabilia salmonicolor TaxID=989 RepID=A0A2T0XRC3_9BACT|nr:ATP-binding protein [Marinilabilia salmonicolor]PRZ01422.1 two-component system phosphate regulon sensor histidine kinase PhoR [Marinilabilia salmonicolor]RCW29562.1 two-component system phosphate regulon sensor histidine kinase PhoR [Marinilabilia salmonicolor]
MKSIAPQRIVGYITITFLVLALLFFLINYFSPNLPISLLITIPLFTGIAFSAVNHLISLFIYAKIKPIYKSIHNFKPGIKESQDNHDDIFSQVNREVAEWMKGKTMEIQQLRQLEKYRREFLGNVSHELKTPVFNIQGYILTLLEGGIDDPAINMLYLERTERSIDRMISIIEDLEAISKLESGELELNITKFNIYQMVEEAFDLQEVRADKRKIKLKFGKSADKNIFVKGDKPRIFQVISNLIVNSINYGIDGGQTTISFYDMDNLVLVEVRDNGVGISERDLPRVFERFYRADKSRSREQGGTGLGLAIVKHIIEAHKQTINVNSTPGKGTSFTFTLEKA